MVKKVYICSPCRGDYSRNMRRAQNYEDFVTHEGHRPICPHLHLTRLLDDDIEVERQIGMNLGLQLLLMSDELWVFGDPRGSEGMQNEISYWIKYCKRPIKYYNEKMELKGQWKYGGQKNRDYVDSCTTTDDSRVY